MSVTEIIVALVLALLAGSYGWGMRGSAIGGEKGAMLPGALLGILLAWCSGVEIIQNNLMYFAAVGAIGMYFGGTETYGQTIGFVILKRPSPDYKRGLVGLMLKGGCWFGIFAAIFGIAFSARFKLAEYSHNELIVAVAALIPARYLGIAVFNKPFCKKKGKFPRINFSIDRREEWGGLLLMLVVLTVFAAVKADSFTLWLIFAGVFGGAVGWAIAINIYMCANVPNKNGRLLFARLNRLKLFDGWKLMEMFLGGFAAISIMLCFLLQVKTHTFDSAKLSIDELFRRAVGSGAPAGLGSTTAILLLFGLWFVSSVQYSCVLLLKKETDRYISVMDAVNRVIYAYLPLAMLFCLNTGAEYFVAVTAMLWVIAEQQILENYAGFGAGRVLLGVIMFGGVLATAVMYLFFDITVGVKLLWAMWLVLYEVTELIRFFRPSIIKGKKKKYKRKGTAERLRSYGSIMTVHPAFIAEIVALTVYGILKF